MYYRLSRALKERFIKELRNFWSYHPQYASLVDSIQGRYAYTDRPQMGIIVKSGGGSKERLSADNYMGIDYSYLYQGKVGDHPGLSVEWVVENPIAIQNNGGVFPSPPGVYILEVVSNNEFEMASLLDVRKEIPVPLGGLRYQLVKVPLNGSLRIMEEPSGFPLAQGTDYTLSGSVVTLERSLPPNFWITADYRYVGNPGSLHPYAIDRANYEAIPGAVIAFGTRAKIGDKVAVIVQPLRHPANLVFGGHVNASITIDIFARDVHAQEEILDRSFVFLEGILRSRLGTEGLDIEDVSLGADGEDVYDDNSSTYYYIADIGVSLRTEWRLHVPLRVTVRDLFTASSEELARLASQEGEDGVDESPGISSDLPLGIRRVRDPFFVGRNRTFEMIR